MSNPSEHPDQEPAIPARLVHALRALHEPKPAVPLSVDAAILARARAHLRPPSIKARFVLFPQWLAVAAAVALGLGLTFLLRHVGTSPASVAREDIDRNGRIDILDAFALARRLQQVSASDGAADVNGDGVFDQRDIDQVAARAVRVTKG